MSREMFLVKMFLGETSGITFHDEEITLSCSTADNILANATGKIKQVKMHQLNHSGQIHKITAKPAEGGLDWTCPASWHLLKFTWKGGRWVDVSLSFLT